MTTLQNAHTQTINCGSAYGRAKFWLSGATQYAEAENRFAVLFDGKAYFYEANFFVDFEAFKSAAVAAFSDPRGEDLLIINSSARLIELQ